MQFAIRLVLSLTVLLYQGWSDVKTASGNLDFDRDNDGTAEHKLSSTGLGLEVEASTNLHVTGVAVSDNLYVGASSGNNTLEIAGTYGQSVELFTHLMSGNTLSGNTTIMASPGNTPDYDCHILLPEASAAAGVEYMIKKIKSRNPVVVSGSQKIDGASAMEIVSGNCGYLNIMSDGSQWYIIRQKFTRRHVSTANLILYYGFDEVDGTTAFDESNNGNDGTMAGGATHNSNGQVGYGCNFDGSDGQITINTALNPGAENFTMSMWADPDAFTGAPSLLSDKNSEASQGIKVRFTTGGAFRIIFQDGSSNEYDIQATTTISTGSWSHCAVSLDKVNNTCKMYVNGQSVSYTNNNSNNPNILGDMTTGTAAKMGVDPDNTNDYDGHMDEIYIFNRALSDDEILDLYNRGL